LTCSYEAVSSVVEDFTSPIHISDIQIALNQLKDGIVSKRESPCPSCKIGGLQKIFVHLHNLPPILLLNIQNFDPNYSNFSSVNVQSITYDLTAVVLFEDYIKSPLNNTSTTTQNGHYTCIYGKENITFWARDAEVSKYVMSLESFINSYIPPAVTPYILFYTKRDITDIDYDVNYLRKETSNITKDPEDTSSVDTITVTQKDTSINIQKNNSFEEENSSLNSVRFLPGNSDSNIHDSFKTNEVELKCKRRRKEKKNDDYVSGGEYDTIENMRKPKGEKNKKQVLKDSWTSQSINFDPFAETAKSCKNLTCDQSVSRNHQNIRKRQRLCDDK
jgi:hypothetical protein